MIRTSPRRCRMDRRVATCQHDLQSRSQPQTRGRGAMPRHGRRVAVRRRADRGHVTASPFRRVVTVRRGRRVAAMLALVMTRDTNLAIDCHVRGFCVCRSDAATLHTAASVSPHHPRDHLVGVAPRLRLLTVARCRALPAAPGPLSSAGRAGSGSCSRARSRGSMAHARRPRTAISRARHSRRNASSSRTTRRSTLFGRTMS